MDKNKKIIVGTIFAITTLLASLSIYVSWELRRDISPTDSSADTRPTEIVLEPTKDIKKDKTPTKVPPTKVAPTGVAPTQIIPTKVLPTGVAPTQVDPTQVAPTSATGGGGATTPLPSGPLPSTALVNDRADAFIFGSLLMLTGIVLYKKYLNFGDKHTR